MTEQIFDTELSNREFFIRMWEHECAVFVDVIKALPPDQLNYRPHPGSRSAGELVALLVSLQKSGIALCETGRASYNATLQMHPSGAAATLNDMATTFEHEHRILAEKLNRLDDQVWNRPAWLTRGEQEIIMRNSVGGLLWLSLLDGIHHRGQLSTYIRPMGGKVPSIYGPSADSPSR